MQGIKDESNFSSLSTVSGIAKLFAMGARFWFVFLQVAVVVGAWVASITVYKDQATEKVPEEVLWVLPWYALVLFGCYTFMRVGIDLISFNDYPEEIEVLEGDIKKARHDLEIRGFVSKARRS